jgi:hypothetical protein
VCGGCGRPPRQGAGRRRVHAFPHRADIRRRCSRAPPCRFGPIEPTRPLRLPHTNDLATRVAGRCGRWTGIRRSGLARLPGDSRALPHGAAHGAPRPWSRSPTAFGIGEYLIQAGGQAGQIVPKFAVHAAVIRQRKGQDLRKSGQVDHILRAISLADAATRSIHPEDVEAVIPAAILITFLPDGGSQPACTEHGVGPDCSAVLGLPFASVPVFMAWFLMLVTCGGGCFTEGPPPLIDPLAHGTNAVSERPTCEAQGSMAW